MREAEFQRTVQQAAGYLGWYVVHFPNMISNPAGWPDLLLMKNGKVLLLELKGEKGRLGPRQAECHERLRAAGMHIEVVRPSDWDRLEALLKGVA